MTTNTASIQQHYRAPHYGVTYRLDLDRGYAGAPTRGINFDASTDISQLELQWVKAKLSQIARLTDNWDGFGSLAPRPMTINHALSVLPGFYTQAKASDYDWSNPYVSSSEEGEIVLEWWHLEKKLSIYIGPDSSAYLCVWGADIATEMDDGNAEDGGFFAIWEWLHS